MSIEFDGDRYKIVQRPPVMYFADADPVARFQDQAPLVFRKVGADWIAVLDREIYADVLALDAEKSAAPPARVKPMESVTTPEYDFKFTTYKQEQRTHALIELLQQGVVEGWVTLDGNLFLSKRSCAVVGKMLEGNSIFSAANRADTLRKLPDIKQIVRWPQQK